jgi:molybdate transport system ATP-binding protein
MLEFDVQWARRDFELALKFRAQARSVALFGPSGCGKTTSLLAIAGLRRPQAGRIVLDGRVLFDSTAGVDVPAAARQLGVVFQDGRLFPHLSVRDNLLYGRRAQNGAHGIALDTAVQLLELEKLLPRRPQHLSGGEARRVAIGRALLCDPLALLLDEPLTGLHRDARAQVLDYLRRLRGELDLPIVLVSHQPDEVAVLAQEVMRVDDGRLAERLDIDAFASRYVVA